jgi:hypothetical protein
VQPLADTVTYTSSDISINAPRAGCNNEKAEVDRAVVDFNQRTPCGVQQDFLRIVDILLYFNQRTPCGVQQQNYTI